MKRTLAVPAAVTRTNQATNDICKPRTKYSILDCPLGYHKMQNTLNISQIFTSIQGESSLAGLPSLFIRLSGCNMRCAYCDTAYAFEKGRTVSIDDVLAHVPSNPPFHVTITGGEPLLQPAIIPLIQKLLQRNCQVVVFTNGTRPITDLPDGVIRVMDIKTPWAEGRPPDTYTGYVHTPYLDTANLSALTHIDQVKFVIRNRAEFLWSLDFLSHNPMDLPAGNTIFSPESATMPPALLARWVLDSGKEIRLGLQIHTLLATDPEPPK